MAGGVRPGRHAGCGHGRLHGDVLPAEQGRLREHPRRRGRARERKVQPEEDAHRRADGRLQERVRHDFVRVQLELQVRFRGRHGRQRHLLRDSRRGRRQHPARRQLDVQRRLGRRLLARGVEREVPLPVRVHGRARLRTDPGHLPRPGAGRVQREAPLLPGDGRRGARLLREGGRVRGLRELYAGRIQSRRHGRERRRPRRRVGGTRLDRRLRLDAQRHKRA